MKTWATPVVVEVNVKDTAHNIFGNEYDNGYVGDGHLGLLKWSDNNCGGDDDDDDKKDPVDKLS